MFIFQKEEKETSRESPPIDRKRDGIMFSEISDLGFAPPSINEFSAFLIDGDDYYGKFFKFSERYMFVGINASGDKISQINALNKLLVNFKKVEFEFLRFVHSEEVLKKYSAPNIRICYIEASPAEPFDEFYLRILSDNSAYEYECLLRDFKFYKISEIKN